MKKLLILIALVAMLPACFETGSGKSSKSDDNDDNDCIVTEHVSLGSHFSVARGITLQGEAIIEYRSADPEVCQPGPPPVAPAPEPLPAHLCYNLRGGQIWYEPEVYTVDPTNASGLDHSRIFGTIETAMGVWEAQTSVPLFGSEVPQAFDRTTVGASPDGVNSFIFGELSLSNALAIAYSWWDADGRMVEWDIIFDDVDFVWTHDPTPGTYDFASVVTHELGHVLGLGHPVNDCPEETMFAFTDINSTRKRDLNGGDILGLQTLYGE